MGVAGSRGECALGARLGGGRLRGSIHGLSGGERYGSYDSDGHFTRLTLPQRAANYNKKFWPP